MASSHDVIDLVEQLVAIDSSNPSLAGGGPGEAAVARFVADWAADAGLQVQVIEQTLDRPSVVMSGGRDAGGRRLLLCGHLDTVGLADMDDPLAPRRDGDRLLGRGAYDMKAGLAAAMVACREASAAGIDGQVVVAAVADEEHASLGVQDVLAGLDPARIDAAIVTEPTELEIAIAHKGFVWTEIEVTGRAAHGSRPHLGVDAIAKTGPILVALTHLDRRLATTPHPLLGAGTVHASLISGGVEESTIPDHCLLTIERRTLPGETAADVRDEVADLLATCRANDPDLQVTSRTTLVRSPMSSDRSTPIATTLEHASAEVLGDAAPISGVTYWADAAFIAEAGIPTVLFGPAGDGAHATVEWVSVDSTIACARTLIRTATTFCG